ncbi:flagellar hook protein FlgE [Caldithrix abyssi]|uniref:Flagellar hook protein FlgE n=1 Tax=Caldithrix abyssi DSM 13497 TaxID=880073 RepID=H1XQ01_CALAY|nr:flagellar hook protein FlgE [Caldithrix abyssi]APF18227.1 flagellar hook protein FlgE [Caldithrix abyssi DSM 13497]EHO42252.1 flagellar hook-basal body protein [Caldithrix abyssi DSM 13497]
MLRSLLSGVSGLRNHQMRMDVIGNNIANINTIGFKSGRLNFSEALSQTIGLTSATSVNPMQIGLGMQTTSIENLFNQGSLEQTGVLTDLAIQGDGFFVLNAGEMRVLTRAGQFFFDTDGKLVNHSGLAVQGWMLNQSNQSIGFGTGNLSDITIDMDMVSEAKETQNIWLSGNLNAGLKTTSEVWTLGSALTIGGANADASTALNALDQINTPLVAGDTIEITGTNPDGTAVSATYTYSAGDTIQDLLDAINSAFNGATAAMVDGKIVLTDTEAGDSSTSIRLTNGAANTGRIDLANFVNTVAGETGRAKTSVVIYDSLGVSHNVILEFTKTANTNEWTWVAKTTGDEEILSGGSGRVTFNEAGKLTSFTFDNGDTQLQIDPKNGSEILSIDLHTESGEGRMGLTQFESLSTISVKEQDGRAVGRLVSLTIDNKGVINGTFSNGENMSLAKIALAQVPNKGGLIQLGKGLYQAGMASGSMQIEELDEKSINSIISGTLEMSNVDVSKEFTEMITTQRGFEASAKVITTADQMLDELIRLKR